jgi:hypothetical protein
VDVLTLVFVFLAKSLYRSRRRRHHQSSSSSSSTKSYGSYWSVPAPEFGPTISSLVFQDFDFHVDGTAKPL